MSVKWFKPRKHTGWKKDQTPATRRRRLIASTRGEDLNKRRLEAGRRAQALANVTRDPATRRKASADAKYFFRMLKK